MRREGRVVIVDQRAIDTGIEHRYWVRDNLDGLATGGEWDDLTSAEKQARALNTEKPSYEWRVDDMWED